MAGHGGSVKLDFGALSAEQQDKLRQYKIKTRMDNEKYLRSHPEVEVLVSNFLRDVLLKRPADIREFAADHFTSTNLSVVIGSKIKGNSDMD